MNIEYFHPSDIIKFRLKACSVFGSDGAAVLAVVWVVMGEISEHVEGCNFSLNSYLMKCSEMICTFDGSVCCVHRRRCR